MQTGIEPLHITRDKAVLNFRELNRGLHTKLGGRIAPVVPQHARLVPLRRARPSSCGTVSRIVSRVRISLLNLHPAKAQVGGPSRCRRNHQPAAPRISVASCLTTVCEWQRWVQQLLVADCSWCAVRRLRRTTKPFASFALLLVHSRAAVHALGTNSSQSAGLPRCAEESCPGWLLTGGLLAYSVGISGSEKADALANMGTA